MKFLNFTIEITRPSCCERKIWLSRSAVNYFSSGRGEPAAITITGIRFDGFIGHYRTNFYLITRVYRNSGLTWFIGLSKISVVNGLHKLSLAVGGRVNKSCIPLRAFFLYCYRWVALHQMK